MIFIILKLPLLRHYRSFFEFFCLTNPSSCSIVVFMAPMRNDRQDGIQAYINAQGRATVNELCASFAASESTIRRDLDELASKGHIKRVHGGARTLSSPAPEAPVYSRAKAQREAKQAIGKSAAALVSNGETVFLGSGSTVLAVARNLVDREITVITNSIPVCNVLSESPKVEMIIAGGFLRKEELSLVGHTVERMLSDLRGDKVIMGIQGIHLEQGLTNTHLPEAIIDRAIVGFTSHLIVVADHTKFGKINSSFVADLSAVHTVVTDSGTPPEVVHALLEKGIEVVIAQTDSDGSAESRSHQHSSRGEVSSR
jgi:DeoR family transcriptional regulator of aga operon